MNPFDGYIETSMTVEPSTYTLELEAGIGGEDVFTVNGLTTEAAEICGWMGFGTQAPLTPSQNSQKTVWSLAHCNKEETDILQAVVTSL